MALEGVLDQAKNRFNISMFKLITHIRLVEVEVRTTCLRYCV